jgi:sorting and assembly machinery component 37
MALELHVWGPAFGLESIDAECLAAITVFRHTLSTKDWHLVADSDTSVSPDSKLTPRRSSIPILGLAADRRRAVHRYFTRCVSQWDLDVRIQEYHIILEESRQIS